MLIKFSGIERGKQSLTVRPLRHQARLGAECTDHANRSSGLCPRRALAPALHACAGHSVNVPGAPRPVTPRPHLGGSQMKSNQSRVHTPTTSFLGPSNSRPPCPSPNQLGPGTRWLRPGLTPGQPKSPTPATARPSTLLRPFVSLKSTRRLWPTFPSPPPPLTSPMRCLVGSPTVIMPFQWQSCPELSALPSLNNKKMKLKQEKSGAWQALLVRTPATCPEGSRGTGWPR